MNPRKLPRGIFGDLQIPSLTAIQVENLAAGADIAARAEFASPASGCVLTRIGIVPQGASAGVNDANTAVIEVSDGAGNAIATQTYNTATQPPAANTYGSLGALVSPHHVLTANEVVRLAVTQGAAADLPAFVLLLEWYPS